MANAKVYDMDGHGLSYDDDPALQNKDSLENYVIWKVQEWEDNVESN